MNIIQKINNSDYKFILGSNSPRRKELLKMIGLEFEVIVSDVDEDIPHTKNYSQYVNFLSEAKAKSVMQHCSQKFDKLIILAADTIVVNNENILNKPSNFDEAFGMLSALSNNTHRVFTGFTIIISNCNDKNNDKHNFKIINDFEVTEVTFRKLSNIEITDYINTGSPMDKAGAYGIQEDLGAVFVSKINGCYYNVVGLPLQKIYVKLAEIFEDLVEN